MKHFILSLFLMPSIAFGNTVCWSSGTERSCGNSVVFDSGVTELSGCKKSEKCKRLAITDSHLTIESKKIEICDNKGTCFEVPPHKILRNVINDSAVLEVDITSSIQPNSLVVGRGNKATLESHQLTIGGMPQDLLSGEVLDIKQVSEEASIVPPPWLKKPLVKDPIEKSWESRIYGHGSYLVAPGMSGSRLRKDKGFGILHEVDGIITGHHRYLPYSSYAKIEDIKILIGDYLNGERGYDKESERLKARWQIDPITGTKYRRFGNGTHLETSIISTKTGGGGGVETDGPDGVKTGGGGGVETDGPDGVKTGGGGGVETDSPECSLSEDDWTTRFLKALKNDFRIYPGVIIYDKQVIGFSDKKNNRIIYAGWETLIHPDVASGAFKEYIPYYEDQFSAQTLLSQNRPDLKSGKTERFCVSVPMECLDIRVKNDVLEIIPVRNEQAKFKLKLKDLTSKDIFKNIPISLASGRSTSLWLPELFLPDEKLDGLRDYRKALIGGDHTNSLLEIFVKQDSATTTNQK